MIISFCCFSAAARVMSKVKEHLVHCTLYCFSSSAKGTHSQSSSRSRESTMSGMRCAVSCPAQCLRILTLPREPVANGNGAVASGRNGGGAAAVDCVDCVDWLSVRSVLRLV